MRRTTGEDGNEILWYTNCSEGYAAAMSSRLLKITDLFCRISSLLEGSFAKQTYNFKESNSHSQPIVPQRLHRLCLSSPSTPCNRERLVAVLQHFPGTDWKGVRDVKMSKRGTRYAGRRGGGVSSIQ